MPFPFEAEFADVQANPDSYIDGIFDSLETEFLVMPRGDGFIEYAVFDAGYEALKSATRSFNDLTLERILPLVFERPIILVVLRCILGLTPPEWASVVCLI